MLCPAYLLTITVYVIGYTNKAPTLYLLGLLKPFLPQQHRTMMRLVLVGLIFLCGFLHALPGKKQKKRFGISYISLSHF